MSFELEFWRMPCLPASDKKALKRRSVAHYQNWQGAGLWLRQQDVDEVS